MKHSVLLFLLLSSSHLFAQQSLKQALDNFHYTLAFTYHPMVDDSNFTPIRKRSAQLATDAGRINRVADSTSVKDTLLTNEIKMLQNECVTLDRAINGGASDEVVAKQLSSIHSRFHKLEEMLEERKE